MMTTQVYLSPSSLSFELSNNYVTFSAANMIYNNILTSYEYSVGNDFPIAVTMKTHNTRYKLDDMYTNSVLPCLSIDCFPLYLFCELSCQLNQITSVLSTLLLLHRTLHLIITSLLLLIYNPYFNTLSC